MAMMLLMMMIMMTFRPIDNNFLSRIAVGLLRTYGLLLQT